ncbi:MAG: tyrosine-type recombinase/integrase, partial [Deltaproteobacteria bacterium]|nr:tyrosine-type recombinase/integrase [Deltaproteobacteria bacterium]
DDKRFGDRYRRLVDAAGVEARAHPFHRLRHTFCTRLLESGVEPYLVSKWAGHQSTEFTERVYASWVPGDDHREKINRPQRRHQNATITPPQ